jgi:hypothetical protein
LTAIDVAEVIREATEAQRSVLKRALAK